MEKWIGILLAVPCFAVSIWIAYNWLPNTFPFIFSWVVGTGLGLVVTLVLLAIIMLFNKG
jgi:hypothetical protein